MKNIYVVEDTDAIRESLHAYLELSGFMVKSFVNIKDIERAITKEAPDLAILDVMLPDGDGFLLAKRLLSKHKFPIIFMTAKSSESDRIMGFELGADDYIVKPFSPKELVLRVKAVLNRIEKSEPATKEENDWVLGQDILHFDQSRHSLSVNDDSIILTAAEWKILAHLIENFGSVISREHILEYCLDYSYDSNDRIVDTHIKNIRSKLGSSSWISTIRGYGYVFTGKQQ